MDEVALRGGHETSVCRRRSDPEALVRWSLRHNRTHPTLVFAPIAGFALATFAGNDSGVSGVNLLQIQVGVKQIVPLAESVNSSCDVPPSIGGPDLA